MVEYITNEEDKEAIASRILNNLPDWFGLPESTRKYILDSRNMPFWAFYEDNQPKGFIALKETSTFTAEIYVMGVLKEKHHQGIGTALWEAFAEYAREKGYEYVQVKTVQKGHYKEYDISNSFYERMGFKELECIPTLWDEWNPCQIYVKYIGQA